MPRLYLALKRRINRIVGVFFLGKNNVLGYVLNPNVILGRGKVSVLIGNFFCRAISNQSLYAAIYPVVYDSKSKQADRLQNPDVLSKYQPDFRSALLGFDKSFIGRLLVWRNRYSAFRKRSYLRCGSKERDNIVLLTRSWHFLSPVKESIANLSDFDVKTVDINKFDAKNMQLSKGKNKSKHFRKQAFELLNQGVSWQCEGEHLGGGADLCNEIEAIEQGDIYLVDWLNHNALWAITHLPADKPIVVRVHSYEVFSYFPLVLDFGRISGLIFISEGIKNAFYDLWGWLVPRSVKSTVLHNIRDLSRLPDINLLNTKNNVSKRLSREKCVGVLQYAEPVKDLEFALSLFSKLYEKDPEFKLFLAGKPVSEQDLTRKRKIDETISSFPSGVIIEMGYLNDVSVFFETVGFILSVSKREGSHESVIEGMLSGCIPVVRDWPLLKPFKGAESAFPGIPVHTTESQMADYILSSVEEFSLVSNEAHIKSDYYYNQKNEMDYVDFLNSF